MLSRANPYCISFSQIYQRNAKITQNEMSFCVVLTLWFGCHFDTYFSIDS